MYYNDRFRSYLDFSPPDLRYIQDLGLLQYRFPFVSIPSQFSSAANTHFLQITLIITQPSLSCLSKWHFYLLDFLKLQSLVRCITPFVFYLQLNRISFKSKHNYLMSLSLFKLTTCFGHCTGPSSGHKILNWWNYFIYESHCTVSSFIYLVTWRSPSARAETCRQLE